MRREVFDLCDGTSAALELYDAQKPHEHWGNGYWYEFDVNDELLYTNRNKRCYYTIHDLRSTETAWDLVTALTTPPAMHDWGKYCSDLELRFHRQYADAIAAEAARRFGGKHNDKQRKL